MTTKPLIVFALASLSLAAPLLHAAQAPLPKQLAGPPEEFAAMRPGDPAATAIYSRSALIPIALNPDASGKVGWEGELPVENGRLRFLMFSANNANWQIDMVSPSGQVSRAADLSGEVRPTEFSIEQAGVPANYYALENLQRGTWSLRVTGDHSRSRDGYVLIEGDAATELVSYPTHRHQIVGENLSVTAALSGTRQDVSTLLGKGVGRIEQASLRVTSPGGEIRHHRMFDDGRHADGAAGDGVYAGDFPADSAGQYLAQVNVRGTDANGQRVLRSAEHVLAVVESSLELSRNTSALIGRAGANDRISVAIPVQSRKPDQHYRVYAEVWGSDSKGEAKPVAWLGGMLTPQSGALSLSLDQRWLARAAVLPPYQLRALRIEDPDHFITLASAERLALELPRQTSRTRFDGVIDDSMRMGARPADLTKGVGQRLLLVHGYCSGGVWPAAQFSTASTFLDVNQNRSHDQFARLLQSFGSTWNSFGTVAHSQGGAAALHLYTYYWSGLDNATGSRLMQSVGTPYQGTNLAGILATLGSWFGVGCGTNDNLSYSGATAWLAGIPASSRAKVNYYTTSFRSTNWWTNDYCNIATDLVLNDPEDGTTEQAKGQLSGASNRGHTTGQCHTSGMRDPAQYLDSSRNASMNANAAR